MTTPTSETAVFLADDAGLTTNEARSYPMAFGRVSDGNRLRAWAMRDALYGGWLEIYAAKGRPSLQSVDSVQCGAIGRGQRLW